MNKTNFLTAVATIMLLVGCCNDDNRDIPSPVSLNVTGEIRSFTDSDDDAWDLNDEIGVFMFNTGATTICKGAENRKYITADGTGRFKPATTPVDHAIYLPIIGKTDFMAYYPYTDVLGTDDKTYTVDVSTQTSQKAIDLMAADKVVDKDKDHSDVIFEFTHKLVKIVLTEIKNGEGVTAEDLKGMTIKLTGQRTKATYNVIVGGNVAVDEAVEKAEIPLLVAADSKSAEAIVLPAATTVGMELVFTLTNGSVFYWAVNNDTSGKFEQFNASQKYSYKIIISHSGLTVTSTVNDWITVNGDNGEAYE